MGIDVFIFRSRRAFHVQFSLSGMLAASQESYLLGPSYTMTCLLITRQNSDQTVDAHAYINKLYLGRPLNPVHMTRFMHIRKFYSRKQICPFNFCVYAKFALGLEQVQILFCIYSNFAYIRKSVHVNGKQNLPVDSRQIELSAVRDQTQC